MKKTILLAVFLFILNGKAIACSLSIYVDKTESNSVVFNLISPDNKYQYTSVPISPGKDTSPYFSNLVCGSYNIYAQKLDLINNLKSPYGDYVYMYNPLQLNGELSLYFPQDFKLDTSSNSIYRVGSFNSR